MKKNNNKSTAFENEQTDFGDDNEQEALLENSKLNDQSILQRGETSVNDNSILNSIHSVSLLDVTDPAELKRIVLPKKKKMINPMQMLGALQDKSTSPLERSKQSIISSQASSKTPNATSSKRTAEFNQKIKEVSDRQRQERSLPVIDASAEMLPVNASLNETQMERVEESKEWQLQSQSVSHGLREVSEVSEIIIATPKVKQKNAYLQRPANPAENARDSADTQNELEFNNMQPFSAGSDSNIAQGVNLSILEEQQLAQQIYLNQLKLQNLLSFQNASPAPPTTNINIFNNQATGSGQVDFLQQLKKQVIQLKFQLQAETSAKFKLIQTFAGSHKSEQVKNLMIVEMLREMGVDKENIEEQFRVRLEKAVKMMKTDKTVVTEKLKVVQSEKITEILKAIRGTKGIASFGFKGQQVRGKAQLDQTREK